jgi:hypothetical protein
MQDDTYKGRFIPKGSVVFTNALYVCSWSFSQEDTETYCVNRSISWDDNIYSDPTNSYPERYLPASAGGNDEPYPIAAFGFG